MNVISLSLTDDHAIPVARVTELLNGQHYICVHLDTGAVVRLPGYDAAASTYARALAAELMRAAEQIESVADPAA